MKTFGRKLGRTMLVSASRSSGAAEQARLQKRRGIAFVHGLDRLLAREFIDASGGQASHPDLSLISVLQVNGCVIEGGRMRRLDRGRGYRRGR